LAALQFDVAVKGVYLATRAASEAGVSHGVYASSMSVFADYPSPDGPIGDIAPDQTHFYGLAKRLGEEVIQAAVRTSGMSVLALRLCMPMSDADWLATEDPMLARIGTAGSDVSSAFRAALRRRGHGFEAVAISGDRHSRYADLKPARDLLGWQPSVVHPLYP
jgi:nucleoside-diphosphate-sugar epimerase